MSDALWLAFVVLSGLIPAGMLAAWLARDGVYSRTASAGQQPS